MLLIEVCLCSCAEFASIHTNENTTSEACTRAWYLNFESAFAVFPWIESCIYISQEKKQATKAKECGREMQKEDIKENKCFSAWAQYISIACDARHISTLHTQSIRCAHNNKIVSHDYCYYYHYHYIISLVRFNLSETTVLEMAVKSFVTVCLSIRLFVNILVFFCWFAVHRNWTQ